MGGGGGGGEGVQKLGYGRPLHPVSGVYTGVYAHRDAYMHRCI